MSSSPPTATCSPDGSLTLQMGLTSLFVDGSLSFLFFHISFYCSDFIWFMRKFVFVFGLCFLLLVVEIKKRGRECGRKRKGGKREKSQFLFNRVIILGKTTMLVP